MGSFSTSAVRLGALAAFKSAVDAGSLNQAANLLFLSQSALSQQIRALETSLGVELLRRTSRGIEPTAEGITFYDYCCEVLEQTVAVERQIRTLREGTGEVWLGVETVLGEHLLPPALVAFRKANKEAGIRLTIDHTHEIVDAVRQGTVHLGIVPDQEDDPHLRWTHLHDEPLVVICHPDHPLAHAGEVDVEQLGSFPYVARESWTKCRQLSTRALATIGVNYDELDIVVEMKTFAGKKSAVMANMGYSLAPWCGVWRELADGSLAEVPIRGYRLAYPVFLVERASWRLPKLHEVLRTFLLGRAWRDAPHPRNHSGDSAPGATLIEGCST